MLNAPCVLENSLEIVEHFLKTVSTSNVRSSVVKDQIRISAKMISRFAGTGKVIGKWIALDTNSTP